MGNKAVVLGSNYYIGLSIIRCLGSEGVYTVAVDYSKNETYGAKSKYVKEQLIGPHYKKESEKFLEFLIDYAKKQDLKPVLFPGADPYVEFMDNHFDELKKYYLFPMTEKGLWTEVMDKEKVHALAVKHGVLVPETARPEDKDFYLRIEHEIKYPCIIKPTDSPSFVAKFRKKIFYVNNKEELDKGLKLAKDNNLDVIVQRIIPGFDDHMYTFDAYMNQDSEVTHWMTCQKYRQYPINFGASVYTGQKYVEELYDIGAPFFKALGYKGFGEIEFKKDEKTGKYYFIEINARTTNLNSLLYKAGINFPYLAYKEMIGKPIGTKEIKYDTGIIFRYLHEDLLAIRDYTRKGQLSYGSIIKSLFAKKAPAIWSFNDPKPGFDYFGMMMKKVGRKLKG
ncbi:MAG: carboxylate--amine ligase [Tissierellaceae bacterium]|nr:carboxylate--amine ligase [Tissierellaceae bacterium]